ncbi:MAG: DUF389 domain-containing protein [Patescibacteria group bacterium]
MWFRQFFIVNDIREVHEIETFDKINKNTQLSTSYIVLLIGSSIVCTLGLLLNATAIVIGGMIISPLMWPLMKISLGISYEKRSYIRQSLYLLILSIAIGIISAFIITYVSPIKLISDEILARTNPTLLDIFVALVAGTVASLALIQPRISESLAGVAIATSLMPPLCVSGIGLALAERQIFTGGLLLFLANIVSIIFIAVILFYLVGIRRSTHLTLRSKGIVLIGIVLILTSIPLFTLLRQYSFKVFAYNRVNQVLTKGLEQISPNISLEGVRTELSKREGQEVVIVTAQLWIPEDFSINFNQRERIVAQLQHELKRKVDLNLRLQKTISVISEQDILLRSTNETIKQVFVDELNSINSAVSIDSLNIYPDQNATSDWIVEAVLRGDPTSALSVPQLEEIETKISKEIEEDVEINVEIISRIKLQTNPELENQKIKSDIQKALYDTFPDIEISNISFTNSESQDSSEVQSMDVIVELKTTEAFTFDEEDMQSIKNLLQAKYNRLFTITLETIEVDRYEL